MNSVFVFSSLNSGMGYAAIQVIIAALVTALLRFLPFLVFKNRETPKLIVFLGTVLPMAIMGMLVVFCLKAISFDLLVNWLPAFISIGAVIVMHIWKRNTLLSILGGTVIYMALINMVF